MNIDRQASPPFRLK